MIIHDIPQRTKPWYAIRRGKLTASAFGMFIANPQKDATSRKAWQNAIDSVLGDEADGDDTDPGFDNYWMKRGVRLEPEALAAYESRTGHHVDQFGFIEHESGFLGCSPDGMIFDRTKVDYLSHLKHGLEMKCPRGAVHRKYRREGVLPAEYAPQVHGSMAITGAQSWDFLSWHPNLPLFLITVRRDEFTEAMRRGLLAFADECKRQREMDAEEWDEHFGALAKEQAEEAAAR